MNNNGNSGPNESSMNKSGMNKSGMNKSGMNKSGMNKSGMNKSGMNKSGMNKSGMNELDFRRRLLADPNDKSPDMQAYLRDNPTLTAEVQRLRRLDHSIREVMQVPVPEGLESRILVRQSWTKQAPKRLAWAASILLTISVASSVSYYVYDGQIRRSNLQTTLVKLTDNALAKLDDTVRVDPNQVKSLISHIGAYLKNDLGTVYYAKKCNIKGQNAAHLVVASEHGPITLFMLPGETRSATSQIQFDDQQRGLLVPAGQGSIAVLGQTSESLQATAQQINLSLAWF